MIQLHKCHWATVLWFNRPVVDFNSTLLTATDTIWNTEFFITINFNWAFILSPHHLSTKSQSDKENKNGEKEGVKCMILLDEEDSWTEKEYQDTIILEK